MDSRRRLVVGVTIRVPLDLLCYWRTNRLPAYVSGTPKKQPQVRGHAGFSGVRIGLWPMMKHPCFMY